MVPVPTFPAISGRVSGGTVVIIEQTGGKFKRNPDDIEEDSPQRTQSNAEKTQRNTEDRER